MLSPVGGSGPGCRIGRLERVGRRVLRYLCMPVCGSAGCASMILNEQNVREGT